ncbi:hypothetical protein HZS_3254 [Henneguya salminicola]|nr:hypothetical protein HZS_3254 [Henneguya salminicola]
MVASAGTGCNTLNTQADIVRYKLEKELGILDKNVVIGVSRPMIHSYNKYLISEVGKPHFDKHKALMLIFKCRAVKI